MPELPSTISAFLFDHHVVSLATISAGELWAASCFYAFDPATVSLVVLSSEKTRHGAAMLAHGSVAGTIAGQPASVTDVRGVQFVARAAMLDGEAGDEAYAYYCKRHPIARLKRSAVWRLTLTELKHTDNAKIFGRKAFWQREDRTEP